MAKLYLKAVFILLALLLTTNLLILAQQRELTTTNRRAKSAFEDAIKNYNLMYYSLAEDEFKNAISYDPYFIEAYLVLSEMYSEQKKFSEAIPYLENALSINPEFYIHKHFLLGRAYIKTGQYKEAEERLRVFLEYEQYSRTVFDKTNYYLRNCEFAISAIENPVPFEPINLGDSINTEHPEYSPVLTADGQTLIFTRKKPRTNPEHMIHGSDYEDFYISFYTEEGWSKAITLGPPINTPLNEGAQTITSDGRQLYFTGCNRPDGMGSCDIYFSFRIGTQWSTPQNLGPIINSRSWDSQPSISTDGQSLYFTSGRRGNFGHMDIWVTHKDELGRWQSPENLGDVINTTGREMSPFIHPDNQTLYFASDGHPGMGGLDLFYSRKDEDGSWTTPVNLGYPINTFADEMSLFVTASGEEAYFASDQLGGFGNLDIYFFELYEKIRPLPITYMKGIVFDSQTKQRLEANIELIDLSSNETIIRSMSDRQLGEFLVVMPTEKNLGLNVSKEGYLFFSENFQYSMARDKLDPYIRDISLQPIRSGETVVLRNIFFDTAKYELLPESIAELQRLLKLLETNPDIKIEISGHTDSIGSYDYNLELSKNRAGSVYNFLIQNGIEKDRLTYEGYADTKPIDTNETSEGRANNRRTEFKVIE